MESCDIQFLSPFLLSAKKEHGKCGEATVYSAFIIRIASHYLGLEIAIYS